MKFISKTLILFLILTCCKPAKNMHDNKLKNDNETKKFELVDFFSDSISIGKSKENKIELLKFNNKIDSSFIVINWYGKSNIHWSQISSDTISSQPIAEIMADVNDYNSDGYGDLRFVKSVGANLANSVYLIFAYSEKTKTLKKVGEGWNLCYSKKLKMFREKYNCSTPYVNFYVLKADSLQKRFNVEFSVGSNSITEFDENGEVVKTIAKKLNSKTEKIPKLNHYLEEWALKNSIE